MRLRNPQIQVLYLVCLVAVSLVHRGMPGTMVAGDGVVLVEVCTAEGLRRVPLEQPVPGGHEPGGACHFLACAHMGCPDGAMLHASAYPCGASIGHGAVSVWSALVSSEGGLLTAFARGPPSGAFNFLA